MNTNNPSIPILVLRSLKQAVDAVVGNLLAVLVPLIALSVFIMGIRNGAEWLVGHGSPMWALIFVLVCGALFLAAVLSITADHMRNAQGRIVPGFAFGLIAAVALMWVYIFAVISYALLELGWVTYPLTHGRENALPDLCDAFLWYFLELIPGLKINEALGWPADVVLTGGWRGFILIIFRIAIVYQVFALGKKLFSAARERPLS